MDRVFYKLNFPGPQNPSTSVRHSHKSLFIFKDLGTFRSETSCGPEVCVAGQYDVGAVIPHKFPNQEMTILPDLITQLKRTKVKSMRREVIAINKIASS
jgi:hypothetical protein